MIKAIDLLDKDKGNEKSLWNKIWESDIKLLEVKEEVQILFFRKKCKPNFSKQSLLQKRFIISLCSFIAHFYRDLYLRKWRLNAEFIVFNCLPRASKAL